MLEIERKFLVDAKAWEIQPKGIPAIISQSYLLNTIEKTIRLRIKDKDAYITIKGPTKGITREEFEYKIPMADAQIMIDTFNLKVLKKKRFEVRMNKTLWEIDVFEGALSGLILAEVELQSEDETFEKPPWLGQEVSHLAAYYNANLIDRL
ncbi:MAG: CYTH domain-containing protein [Crocinitomicaceae bacterium]|nr:CYTH domain-containing protein [Crocinitomicaceae bacterium]